MGIKNLTQLIKKKSPESIQHMNLYSFKDKRIAIDTSIFIYRSLMNVRHNGEYLRNKDGKIISHIQGLYYKTIQYLSLGITPIYIFDGKPPIEKSQCIQERSQKAKESKNKIEQTNNKNEIIKLEKASIRIHKEHIDDLKQLFNYMGVSYIHPEGEAEAYAAELCRKGFVDAVVSEDMDTLVYGCPILIRNCIDKSIKRPDIVTTFNFNKILEDFKMKHKEFIDMCILCGCDYCPTIPKIASIGAYKNIEKYKTIEKFLENNSNPITEEFKSKYPLSRNIFTSFKDKINIDDLPIHSSKFNSENLFNYLVIDCSMNEKKVINSFKKLK